MKNVCHTWDKKDIRKSWFVLLAVGCPLLQSGCLACWPAPALLVFSWTAGVSTALRRVPLDKACVQWWTHRPLESFLGLIKGFWKKEILFPLELLNDYSPEIDSCYSLATQREHVYSRGEYSFHKEDERGERWERKCVLTIFFKDPPLSCWMASYLLVSFLPSSALPLLSFLSFPPCLSSFFPSFWNTFFGIGFLYICNWKSSDFMPVQSFRQSSGTGVGNKGLTNGSLNEGSTFRCSTKLFFLYLRDAVTKSHPGGFFCGT